MADEPQPYPETRVIVWPDDRDLFRRICREQGWNHPRGFHEILHFWANAADAAVRSEQQAGVRASRAGRKLARDDISQGAADE